jgi:hypothetical protein
MTQAYPAEVNPLLPYRRLYDPGLPSPGESSPALQGAVLPMLTNPGESFPTGGFGTLSYPARVNLPLPHRKMCFLNRQSPSRNLLLRS